MPQKTTARRFCEDMTARTALKRLCPELGLEWVHLTIEQIHRRYLVGAQRSPTGDAVAFVDGSAAVYKNDQWIAVDRPGASAPS